MLFVVSDPRSFLFKSNECSPGAIEYTGFVIVFVGESLQRFANSSGCITFFLLDFISVNACSYFFIIKVILMHISERNESTILLIS